MKTYLTTIFLAFFLIFAWSACSPGMNSNRSENKPQALAVESFLADITQNVAGERMHVDSIIPRGLDPHAFEPNPADVVKIAQTNILIVNGAGMEEWLDEVLENAGGERTVITASLGLTSRPVEEHQHEHAEEHENEREEHESEAEHHHHEGDPHFWLDPILVIRYTENIRDGFISADPAGKETYTQNAEHYIQKLKELDAWIKERVEEIPSERRLLVTNHESLGYYADRYGFKVIGAVIPSVSTGASPSAQQVAELVNDIRASGAPAIILETGTNPKLAEQIAKEAGVKIVTDVYTHSLSAGGGKAATYMDMMRYNTQTIVDSLK